MQYAKTKVKIERVGWGGLLVNQHRLCLAWFIMWPGLGHVLGFFFCPSKFKQTRGNANLHF